MNLGAYKAYRGNSGGFYCVGSGDEWRFGGLLC
jgi:hypothetical protein